ncbi:MAG TPA: DUF192 domain-containing protein [Oculatellaceae cyanobacterium]
MGKQVINQTRQTVIVEDLEVADNPIKRLIGLMGRPGLEAGKGLWIVPCNQIHSCFMRFEFDALFLDGEGQVLHTIERMRPWGASKLVWKARVVLELPPGRIQETGTALGDQLILQDS